MAVLIYERQSGAEATQGRLSSARFSRRCGGRVGVRIGSDRCRNRHRWQEWNGNLEALRRMERIGQLDDVAVIGGQATAAVIIAFALRGRMTAVLATTPHVCDGRQDGTAISLDMQVRRNVCVCGVVSVTKDATVALIPEIAVETPMCNLRIPLAYNIPCLLTDELPYVCAHIPASQSMKVPICLDRGQLTVVIVVIVINSTH